MKPSTRDACDLPCFLATHVKWKAIDQDEIDSVAGLVSIPRSIPLCLPALRAAAQKFERNQRRNPASIPMSAIGCGFSRSIEHLDSKRSAEGVPCMRYFRRNVFGRDEPCENNAECIALAGRGSQSIRLA
jgi:hypothetical protein